MKILFFLCAGVLCSLSGRAQTANVELQGSMKSLRIPKTELTVSDIASSVNAQQVATLKADEHGNYKVAFYAEKPGYYEIGHTLMYLSPGDKMTANLGMMGTNSRFEGSGADMAKYLNKAVNVGAWSLFGMAKVPSFEKCKATVDSVLAMRQTELEAFISKNADFYAMENIRLKAIRTNLYLGFFNSGQLAEWKDAPEVKLQKKLAFYRSITSIINPLLKEITASDCYLDLGEVREALTECYQTKVFDMHVSKALVDLLNAVDKSSELDTQSMNQEEYNRMEAFAQSLGVETLKQAFLTKLQAKSKLITGKPAIDMTMKTFDGKTVRLNDLKGKPLFLDFWATWCLPCLAQKPKFEELSKLYPEIQFVGISIDMDENKWQASMKKSPVPEHMKEFIADPYEAGDAWDIHSIPRFILIDKDFNIIAGTAIRPSDTENITKVLDRVAGRK